MIDQQWPTYTDENGSFVLGLPIKKLFQSVDGSGMAEFDGPYQDQYMSASFMSVFNPATGGYLLQSKYGEMLYMSKAEFEEQYTKSGNPVSWDSVTGKPMTFSPIIGTTATTAMAGNKIPTTTERGGVLQQAAITAITDSSGGTSGGNTVPAVPAATAATTDTSAASLASTNASITALKNDIATLSAKLNSLLAAVRSSGVTA